MRNASGTISRAALDNYADDLFQLLTQCVDELPRVGNGRPVAFSDTYAEQVFKDMKSGTSQEIRRLLAVLLGFLARGTKRPQVRLFAQRLDAILAHHGAPAEPRPIRILNRRETREDGMFDLAQLRIEADTEDLGALENIVRQGAFYKASVEELIEAAQQRIVVLRASASNDRCLKLVES